jgi:hypothetical protein
VEKLRVYGNAFYRWYSGVSVQDKVLLKDGHEFVVCPGFQEYARRFLINDLTAPVLIFMARGLAQFWEQASYLFYKRLFKYEFLKGYEEAKESV